MKSFFPIVAVILSFSSIAQAKPIDAIQTILDHGDIWCSDTYAVVRDGSISQGGATWAGPAPAKLELVGDDKIVATHQSSDGKFRYQLTIESNGHLGLKSLAMKLRFDINKNGRAAYSSEGSTDISEADLKRIAAKDYDLEQIEVGTTIFGRVPEEALSANDYGAAIIKKLGLKDGDFNHQYVHCFVNVK